MFLFVKTQNVKVLVTTRDVTLLSLFWSMSPNYISSNVLISQVQSWLPISDTTLHQDVHTRFLFAKTQNVKVLFTTRGVTLLSLFWSMSPNYILSSNILISQVQSRLCISDTTLHQDVDTTGLFNNENTMCFNPEISKNLLKNVTILEVI